MMKKNNITLVITSIICLSPAILAAFVYDKLPDEIAIHFDAAGNPNNYAPKFIAAFGLPLFLAIINFFVNFFISKDPKNENISSSMKFLTKWLIPLLSVVIMPVTLFKSMDADIPIDIIILSVVGLIIVLCGNYLPKCKQNYTVGIKLPWTLHSYENWNRTHRLSGKLWVLGGLLIILNSFIGLAWIMIVIIALIIIIPVIYSYWLYKKGV